jgi:hypothetical protein
MDAHPHPQRTLGTNRCRRLVRLVSLRHVGRPGDHPPFENASHHPVGDLLQSALASRGGISTLVTRNTRRINGRRDHFSVLVGDIADRGHAVGIRVRELHLQPQTSTPDIAFFQPENADVCRGLRRLHAL